MILPTSTRVVVTLAVLVCWLLVDTFADGGQPNYPSPSPSRNDASRLAFVELRSGGRETVCLQRNPHGRTGVAGDAGGRIGRPHQFSAGFSRNHTATRAGAGEVLSPGFDSHPRKTAGPAEGFLVADEVSRWHLSTDWDLYAENTKHRGTRTWTESASEAHFKALPGEKPGVDFKSLLGIGLVGLAMRIGFPDRSRRSHLHLLMRAPQPPAQWSSRTPADPRG